MEAQIPFDNAAAMQHMGVEIARAQAEAAKWRGRASGMEQALAGERMWREAAEAVITPKVKERIEKRHRQIVADSIQQQADAAKAQAAQAMTAPAAQTEDTPPE